MTDRPMGPRAGADGARTLYRIKIGAPPDNESITPSVRLTVIRMRVDAQDKVVGRAEKVRDPQTINGWSIGGARRKAERRGKMIVHEDQLARGVRPTSEIRRR